MAHPEHLDMIVLIPLNLDGLLFSADYQSGKKADQEPRGRQLRRLGKGPRALRA
jgi:hypothetical protein